MKKFLSVYYYRASARSGVHISKRVSICTIHRSSLSNASGRNVRWGIGRRRRSHTTYECNERLSCEIYSIGGARDCRGDFSSRAPPCISVRTYVRTRENSYTAANQSNRNNCHALATQKMHYNALRNVRAISIDESEFMAHRDRILARSRGMIFRKNNRVKSAQRLTVLRNELFECYACISLFEIL